MPSIPKCSSMRIARNQTETNTNKTIVFAKEIESVPAISRIHVHRHRHQTVIHTEFLSHIQWERFTQNTVQSETHILNHYCYWQITKYFKKLRSNFCKLYCVASKWEFRSCSNTLPIGIPASAKQYLRIRFVLIALFYSIFHHFFLSLRCKKSIDSY